MSGMLNATHHAAVMRNAIFIPISMGMPIDGPPNTTAKHAMNGTHEPM